MWRLIAASCSRLDRQAVWKMAKLLGELPTKFRGIHYCYDNENVKLLFALAMYVWERQLRIRCRLHCGTSKYILIFFLENPTPFQRSILLTWSAIYRHRHGMRVQPYDLWDTR